jgi:hypothetical protein
MPYLVEKNNRREGRRIERVLNLYKYECMNLWVDGRNLLHPCRMSEF